MNSVETFADVPVIVERGAAVVEGPGRRGLGRAEVLRRVRRRGAAGGLLRADGHDRPRAAGRGRRRRRRRPTWRRCSPAAPRRTSSARTASTCALDFDTLAEAGSMLGSGALVVLAEGTDVLAAATNSLRFFRNESCGKCVPCRVGSHKAHEILDRGAGRDGLDDEGEERLLELERTLRKTSICGLGQVALGPVASVLGLQRGGAVARPHRARALDGPGGGRMPGREFFRTRTVAEALASLPRRTAPPGGAVGLDDALGRVPVDAGPGAAAAARLRPLDRRRLRRAGGRHVRRVGGAARLPRRRRARRHGHGARCPGAGRAPQSRCPPVGRCPAVPTRS